MSTEIEKAIAKNQIALNKAQQSSVSKSNGSADVESSSMDKLLEQVIAMPDSNPLKQKMLVALGIAKEPVFGFERKVNKVSNKPYWVITVKGAKVQFSLKTAETIRDDQEGFGAAIASAREAEKAEQGSK